MNGEAVVSVLTPKEIAIVGAVMTSAGVELIGDLEATLISGGRSNLTVALADAQTRWVLRTPPREGRTPSAHDVGREFRVTSALASTAVPVASPVAFVEDGGPLGGPFAIWEFVEGTTIQTREQLESLDVSTVDGIANALVESLVALHDVDYTAIGLEKFGRPDAYVERQIARWSKQWELVAPSASRLRSLASEASTRLLAHVPRQGHTSIVHGDYRIDNALLRLGGAEGAKVAAIVDWELSTIGDPLADVATMCAYRNPAFDLVLGFPTAWTSKRLPTIEELISRYEAEGGATLESWGTYLSLAYFKIAVIAAGIDYRWRAKGAPDDGNRTAGEAVEPFLEAALQTT